MQALLLLQVITAGLGLLPGVLTLSVLMLPALAAVVIVTGYWIWRVRIRRDARGAPAFTTSQAM